jgi:predicted nucleotidyltransferase
MALADWPARSHAEAQRQWPIIVGVSERVTAMPVFDGLLLLGSFARGTADEVSDVDLVAVVANGRFSEAWEQREELETPGVLLSWDVLDEGDVSVGSHKWVTRDVVKVECSIVDPARSDMQLAEPYAVIVGDPQVAARFPPMAPIPGDVLEAYAQKLRDGGLVPEVETRYGELREAIRKARLSGE